MNLKTIMPVILILLLIVGCGKEATKDEIIETPPPTTETTTIAEEPAVVVVETPEEPEKPAELTPEIKELLGLYNNKVKSIYFQFKEGDRPEVFSEIFIKGNKIKIILADKIIMPVSKYYDTVYLDTESKKATAYCETKSCDRKGYQQTVDYEEVDFGTYYIKTPLDWISEVTSAEKGRSKQIENREVIELDTNTGKLWVDTFYGVPREIESNGKVLYYQKITFNQVKDEDINPP